MMAPLALVAGGAWALLALASGTRALPALCSSELLWSVPSLESFGLFFAFVPVQDLALGWTLMVAAMMLPTLSSTLGNVWQRSFPCIRPGALAMVTAGYVAVWMLAGVALQGMALGLRLAAPSGPDTALAGLGVAVLWQVSPWKQRALNRCHRRPALAAFAPAVWRDALALGLSQGIWCLASCWALMLASLLTPAHHFAVMALVGIWIWAERLEPPCRPVWQFRAPCRALRLLAYRASGPRLLRALGCELGDTSGSIGVGLRSTTVVPSDRRMCTPTAQSTATDPRDVCGH